MKEANIDFFPQENKVWRIPISKVRGKIMPGEIVYVTNGVCYNYNKLMNTPLSKGQDVIFMGVAYEVDNNALFVATAGFVKLKLYNNIGEMGDMVGQYYSGNNVVIAGEFEFPIGYIYSASDKNQYALISIKSGLV